MSQNYNGFISLTSLYSFSLFLILSLSLLPIVATIQAEQSFLQEERHVVHALANELQQALYYKKEAFPFVISTTISSEPVTISFTIDGEMIKGCAHWSTIRHEERKECLYGKLYVQ
ncbi:hypothetical protein [Pontibacillus litoralis]|uniref:Competence protein ComG n=1 Tax=Pontibacillus litoralis JSM 072002 TaxID=1385512 RepID=A0A0A5GAX9_9BACI|nr:hypothetical protein [Pontibacillus litoralis]KGX89184.1 hypothetical protein N784_00530 [Pontibacillus litoralis JSM 072002]